MSIQERIDKRKCKRFKYFGLQPRQDSCKLGAETLDKSKWCVVCIEKHEAVKIQEMIHKRIMKIKARIDKIKPKDKEDFKLVRVAKEVKLRLIQLVNELKQLCGCGCK